MLQSATKDIVTLLSGCIGSNESLVGVALAQLEQSIEQQILKCLDRYEFSSPVAADYLQQLQSFQYDTSSVKRLYESHEELSKLIRSCGVSFKELATGKFVRMGHYSGEAIVWRIIQVEENGCMQLITDKIMTLKPYATARQDEPYGSADWSQSVLREWLNSQTAKVSYAAANPVKKNVWMEVHSFSKEKGFLHTDHFQPAEVSLLAPFASGDKVSIPGIEEYRLMISRGIETIAKPATDALRQAEIRSSRLSTGLPWSYWLSDPSGEEPMALRVSSKGEIRDGYPYDGTIGVRMMVRLSDNARLTGKGSRDEPYTVSRK